MNSGQATTKSVDSFQEQLRERRARVKRKAEEDLRDDKVKRILMTAPDSHPSTSNPPPSSKITLAYPNGALRITRTPGRQNTKNCANLDDIIHKDHLVSACVFSFFIAEEEFFSYFPFSHDSDAVPIYIGRDANMDSLVQIACQQAGVVFKEKMSNKQLQIIAPVLRQLYQIQYGKNYHAFYAWSPGSSHSKILILVYPDFLRLVITSCNMMNIDTVLGDNHWYIHDLPKLSPPLPNKAEPSPFEAGILAHLQALGTPTAFLDSVRGMYDYSAVQVQLVTSQPGVCAGIKAEKHGLLRLRRAIQDLDLDLPEQESGKLRLEICAASIGNLNAKWLNGFNDCALGKESIGIADADCAVPDLKLFYPTVGDVKSADEDSQQAASNIGCHTRPWNKAPKEIKAIFHHYQSKDAGRLFHQKLILAYNPRNSDDAPYYVYIGSANLSQSAWGALEQDKKKNDETCNTKLVKISNFECGVVIPGRLIENLLEPGTKNWQSGIVPYVQTGKKYELPQDRPWNDPRWVQNFQEDYRGA